MGPITEALPWRISLPTPKPHPPCPSFCSTTSIQVYHANHSSAAVLVKACASSLTCLFCVARPSRAPLNHRAMQHGRRYCGLTLMIPEHPGLCTDTQFAMLSFKALQPYWNRLLQYFQTPPTQAGSSCTLFSKFTFSHSTSILR